jgi:hypothetical protein
MGDFLGFIIAQKIGCFARWLLMGAKGNFNDFASNTKIYFLDYIIGTLLFFCVLYFIVIVCGVTS